MSALPVPTEPAAGPDVEAERGLTADQVADRRARGLVNVTTDDNRRTVADIVRANVFTRFNAILGTLLVVVLATGEYRDALFGIVLVSNALVGIVQELRAKRTLDRLTVLSAPRVAVVRDSAVTEVAAAEVVAGDVVQIETGDQVPVDGVVLAASGLEADESLLTGESDPVAKGPGDEVRSGSFVVAGRGRFRATDVGDAAYAARLAHEAKRFAPVHSELRAGTDTILRIGTYVLVPAAALLVFSQVQALDDVHDVIRSSVAGVAAMIPEGLVLLTSIAFAVGVVRLARRRALVQELPAVEVLARVDVVCVDKTGTITEGTLRLAGVEPVEPVEPDEPVAGDGDAPAGEARARQALGALVAAEERPNPSLQAVAAGVTDPGWEREGAVPFSSARKWSGATFRDHGSWVLGAPDMLIPADHPAARRAAGLAAAGTRVLLLGRSAGPLTERSPGEVEPVALVLLEEQVRADAPDTLAYFADQGVAVKVISGDHPATVGAVAARVGVTGAAVDARDLPDDEDELGPLVEEASVFGRVQPHQKRAMVRALQRRGHVVAMTGDGVNDVLALKDADMGVAMRSGSGACRGVAQLVLLDDSFASLPSVVVEGRRVIANIERVANLFVTKSVYAFLLALFVGFTHVPFPFLPRHLTVVSSLTIGVPAFFLALAPNDRRSRTGFVGRVARFALPAGALAATATFTTYLLARRADAGLIGERTAAVVALFLVALWVLIILARPFVVWKAALVVAMAAGFVITLVTPYLREFFELQVPSPGLLAVAVTAAAAAVVTFEVGRRVVRHRRRRAADA